MSQKTSGDPSLQSTKQMLDELDALMERMLSLPINELEVAPQTGAQFTPPPAQPPNEKAPARKGELAPAASEAVAPSPLGVPHFSVPMMPARVEASLHPPTNPPHVSWPGAPPVNYSTPEPLPAPKPLTNEVEPPNLEPKLDQMLAQVPQIPTPSGLDLVYSTLVRVNQTYDRVTGYLGGVGSWLRGPAARMALGLSGLALLAVSATWFLKDWLGWNW